MIYMWRWDVVGCGLRGTCARYVVADCCAGTWFGAQLTMSLHPTVARHLHAQHVRTLLVVKQPLYSCRAGLCWWGCVCMHLWYA
jgi:hypothetical protein